MPTSLKLGEAIVDAVVTKLKAGYAARVTTINTEFSDFAITAPGTGDYYKAWLEAIPKTPAIVVAEGASEFGEEGPHSFITQTIVGVYVLEQDPDLERLGKRLQRQARALLEVLWDDAPQERLDLAPVIRIFPTGTTPGPVFEPQADQTWRSVYLVTFRVTVLEGS